MEFEWDLRKELLNIKKHQCSFSEAVETFNDPSGLQFRDKKHSNQKEERFYWIGKNSKGRILTTWFTHRGSKIRIIGCAEWRQMRRLYEKTKDE